MMGRIELPNQEKIRMLREKEVDTIKQKEKKEKNQKRVSQENEEITWNQTIQQKSHQWDKHLGCHSCQILRTIFEGDNGGTSTNGENRKQEN